jgi:hypothetical protein
MLPAEQVRMVASIQLLSPILMIALTRTCGMIAERQGQSGQEKDTDSVTKGRETERDLFIPIAVQYT